MASFSNQSQNAEISFGTYLLESLDAALGVTAGSALADHVKAHDTDRWLIFSDYVLSQPRRPSDVFAFTILPGGLYLDGLMADFYNIATRDFKDIKVVGDAMLQLLSDKRLFTLCFVLDPSRTFLKDSSTFRGILDREIAVLRAEENTDANDERLRWLCALRRKASANAFSVRLLENIVLAASLASLVTFLICKTRRATRIGWFSDRDSITTSHDAIVNYLYASYTRVACMRTFHGWRGPELGVSATTHSGRSPWSDAFNRVPDYLTGMISAWNFDKDEIPESPVKYQQVLTKGIAGHSNVQVVRLHFERDGALISVVPQPLAITPKEPHDGNH